MFGKIIDRLRKLFYKEELTREEVLNELPAKTECQKSINKLYNSTFYNRRGKFNKKFKEFKKLVRQYAFVRVDSYKKRYNGIDHYRYKYAHKINSHMSIKFNDENIFIVDHHNDIFRYLMNHGGKLMSENEAVNTIEQWSQTATVANKRQMHIHLHK